MSMTSVSRVYNFSAGPATLPLPVLERIQEQLLALPGQGASILEISHRCPAFDAILEDTRAGISRLLNVPDSHEILFLQGGSALQNVMIPNNLITDSSQVADYIVTGSWGKKSAAEVHRFGSLNVAFDGADSKFNRLPSAAEMRLSPGAAYCHMTTNETIQGVQFRDLPETGSVPIIADKSSDLFSEPVDVSRFGLIYACAQKNAGIAGLTLVILDKSLLARCSDRIPGYLNYANHVKDGSRFNTPPTFAIYVTGLVCQWLEQEIGGLAAMGQQNQEKASRLYGVIDASEGFYRGHAMPECRSMTNVVFAISDASLENEFLGQATAAGMTTLKGHRSLGGIRASIYNAMPREGVEALAQFMQDFAQQKG